MAGALAAPPCRRLTPLLHIWRRSIWSSPWHDSSAAANNSDHRPEQKKFGHRLSSVVDAVNDRKLPPELRGRPNAIRSETDIMNVVEKRIWNSMEEGHFENLPGKGKPLDLTTNPHVDPAEDTLFRILNRNGCAPEWVELNKEIRSKIVEWRSAMRRARDHGWSEDSEALKAQMREINNKVVRYNLIVPFGRQMFGLKWEKEIEKLKSELRSDE